VSRSTPVLEESVKRPRSLTIYSIVVWITKFIPLFAVYKFFEYINAKGRLDFYLGLNLRDIRDYLYVYVAASLLTLIITIFLFYRKKWALQVYFFLKTVEVHCLLMALPTLVYGLQRGLGIKFGLWFHLSAWTFVLASNLIFPLIYFTYKKYYK
jgi:hypothetical protein